jgi:hypothetical protein
MGSLPSIDALWTKVHGALEEEGRTVTMRTLVRAALAMGVAAGMALVAAPSAHAAVDLGRVDFGCADTADDIYGDLPITGSGSNLSVIVNGEIGDTFTIDQDNSDPCLVLNYAGQSVNTLADLGGFVSYGSNDLLFDNPLRYEDSDTVEYVINGPGTFLIQALDNTYYTIVVNGGTPLSGPKDLTIWLQSVGRWAQTDSCPAGYSPSWAQWPNGGTGGWVCDKYTYAYYPGEAVK